MLLVLLVTGSSAFGVATREGVEGNNPTIAQKVLGYDRWVRAHGAAPDVLILGTSRAVEIDPAVVEQRTGRTAYNASVSNGAAREFLTMYSYADLRSPGDAPDVLLMLDLESFDGRQPTVRVRDYQRRIVDARAACHDPEACRIDWRLAAWAIAIDANLRETGGRPWQETQDENGKQIDGGLLRAERDGVDLDAVRARRIGIRSGSYGRGGFDRLYPAPSIAIERLIALANARGVQPTIAITSMHPDCIHTCGPRGWFARRSAVRARLTDLERRYDMHWIDLSYPSSWGGSGASFLDEVHLRPSAALLVIDRLRRFGAFRADDAGAVG